MSVVAVRQRIEIRNRRATAERAPVDSVKVREFVKPAGKADPFTGANYNFKAIESDVRCDRVGERIAVASLPANGRPPFN